MSNRGAGHHITDRPWRRDMVLENEVGHLRVSDLTLSAPSSFCIRVITQNVHRTPIVGIRGSCSFDRSLATTSAEFQSATV